jgi:hypothetical protein
MKERTLPIALLFLRTTSFYHPSYKFSNQPLPAMKTIKTILLLLAAAATHAFTQPSPNFRIDEWQRAKIYTKEYLDAMPEDGYSFKPHRR